MDRARSLISQTRLAIQMSRRVVIDAKLMVILSRSTRRTAKTLRNHHFLPR